jgi:2-haloacid dehalogenase
MSPALLTFDVFGTLVDWRRGLAEALAPVGVALADDAFDRIVDRQGAEERRLPFRSYREIVAASLVAEVGIDAGAADAIAADAGRWPLFPDARGALGRLLEIAPCVALTNSDAAHGAQVEAQLGFRLSAWICSEELRVYKPRLRVWNAAADRLGATLDPTWWHVSAYADYDLVPARALGLTTVLVRRPHERSGPADRIVPELGALADSI